MRIDRKKERKREVLAFARHLTLMARAIFCELMARASNPRRRHHGFPYASPPIKCPTGHARKRKPGRTGLKAHLKGTFAWHRPG
jgi:hypothetical protein